MIQATLADILGQCSLSNVEIIKITGSDKETKVQTFDTDQTLFIQGTTKSPVKEFQGEFGITNLKMLSGLLNFTSYQADDSTFKVNTRKVADETVLDRFEFKGKGSKSVFNLMNAQHVPAQPKIAQIPWDVEISFSTAKYSEFQKFSSLYTEIDKHFVVSTEDGTLIATFGKPNSSIHSGSMTLAEGVSKVQGGLVFPIDKFLTLMKLALNAKAHKVLFSSAGLLGVEVETDHGLYNYYLRQTVRE